MPSCMNIWFILMVSIPMIISLTNPRGESERSSAALHSVSSWLSPDDETSLEYDFYRETCPQAEAIVRSSMARIYYKQKDVPAALLRLFFHDCFILGCDASILLDDSNGDKNRSIERLQFHLLNLGCYTPTQAVPNKSLEGFDKIDLIKEELEEACPGVVSCADIVSVATRDGIVLAGGPFYPVLTGRRDSTSSYYQEALAGIPRPDDDITQTLHLFSRRGFDERETVSLLGGHSIGKIGCDIIQKRVSDFNGTGQPDPSISPDLIKEMRQKCQGGNQTTSHPPPSPLTSLEMNESAVGLSYLQTLSSSMSSGVGFDTHYYRGLLRGRGLLFSDQQLMAEEKTARLVRAYASDDGSTFRMDFARSLMKMSSLSVLTGTQGLVRRNCSLAS